MQKKMILAALGFIFLIGLCILSYGLLLVVGSTSANGNAGWARYGVGFLAFGVLLLAASIFGFFKTNQQESQKSSGRTVIDLPGEVKISQLTCNKCGGSISSADIKLQNNVPMVVCPWCNASYQINEEPKW